MAHQLYYVSLCIDHQINHARLPSFGCISKESGTFTATASSHRLQKTESKLYPEQSVLEIKHAHCHQMLMFVERLVKANKPSTECLKSVLCQNTVATTCVSSI